jgi:hypothetical protein
VQLRAAMWFALFACAPALADQEASNVPFVKTSEWGNCYAKAVPTELYGSKGTTRIYSVRPGEDAVLETYDWFAKQIYLQCGVGHPNEQLGVSLVRVEQWARGRQPSSDQMAIAFYFKGHLVKQYSTLDIAASTSGVSRSVSHYSVVSRVYGYRQQKSNFYSFEVLAVDGRVIVFDPTTGAILSSKAAAK